MPAGDHTGPMGLGPRTGREAGLCAGYLQPGFANPGPGGGGRGWGRGRGGGGRGWRNRHWATGQAGWARAGQSAAPWPGDPLSIREQESESLRAQIELLQSQLAETRNRLAELGSRIGEKERSSPLPLPHHRPGDGRAPPSSLLVSRPIPEEPLRRESEEKQHMTRQRVRRSERR